MAAKNHALIMPDANPDDAINNLINAAFGATGQRCMAISVAVFVGKSKDWIPLLIEKSKKLKVGSGYDRDTDVSPVSYKSLKDNINRLIGTVERDGGKILLDGRNPVIPGYPKGNFVAPTIITLETNYEAYKTEIFGPVLGLMFVDTFEEGMKLINSNHWGNGTAIFTTNGGYARKF